MSALECGSQVAICDVPVRFDTYSGCSHGCKYCFVKRKTDITDVKPLNGIKSLENFIHGKRQITTNWCDWDIPIHWGGLSDPFQPCEEIHRLSMKTLELFAETGYPFIVSTKGKLVGEPRYIDMMERCNALVQISMVSPMYDKLEPGCPTYEERLEICNELSPKVKRVMVRMQPYFTDALSDVINNMPRLKCAGVHGIILEGYKALKKRNGMVKVGGDYAYPSNVLRDHFELIRKSAHDNGLRFYSGENRLRAMGDSLTCCGCDGMDGFRPNTFNLAHIVNGDDVQPTDKMKERGTGKVFQGIFQTAGTYEYFKEKTFEEVVNSDVFRNSMKKALIP